MSWQASEGKRPCYERPDGFKVIMDSPGRWGVLLPGSNDRVKTFADRQQAMNWVDRHHPNGGQEQ